MSAIKKSRPQANGLHVPAIWGEIVGYGFIAVTAVLAPLWLIHLNVPFIRLMDEVYHPIVLLQLFTFTATVALTITLAAKLWQLRDEGFQAAVPFVLGVLVIFHFLALMRQHAARSWDYICYERAAQAIVAGANPYGDCYIYFPTPAQMLATLYHVGAWVSSMADPTGMAAESSARWDLVFYLYESTQLILVAVAFALCYRLARVSGLQRLYAAGLVTALFLLNNPLLATLKHNQVNLWVLNLMLLAILGVARYPLLSGLCVALGGHIKLYPLALLLPWMLKRQWRALFSAGIGLIGIFFLQTNGGRSLTLWQQFLDFADSFPRGTFFRDNSLHSFVYNTLGHLKWLLGEGSFPVNELYVSRFVLLGMGLLGMVYLVRFFQREQTAQRPFAIARTCWTEEGAVHSPSWMMMMGHSTDVIAVALIASPVVWEHHYLLAMPLAICAVAQARGERQLWAVGISLFLMFVMPTFDVYPFSYHRLLGLVLLMVTLAPVPLPQIIPGWRWRNGKATAVEAQHRRELDRVTEPHAPEYQTEQAS